MVDNQAPITWDDVRNTQPPSIHLRFDLEGQTVDGLELTLEHLRRASDRPMSWKWVVIGMHAALHGSFGVALRRTDGAQLLPPEQERQYWERVDRERANQAPEVPIYYARKVESTSSKRPRVVERRVDQFLNLFRKTQEANRMSHFGGVPLRPTPAQKRSVEHLNSIRNDLIHFSDMSRMTDVARLLTDVTDGLDIVETLLTRTLNMAEGEPSNTIMDYELADRARQVIGDLRAELLISWKRYGLIPPG